MHRTSLFKSIVLCLLALVLLVPLSMIRGTISERQERRETARQDIARSWTGPQRLTGPILVVPYRRRHSVGGYDAKLRRTVDAGDVTEEVAHFLPETLQVRVGVETEERYRGLHRIPVYTARFDLRGSFSVPPRAGVDAPAESLTFGEPYLVLAVSDVRGLRSAPRLRWEGQERSFAPGTRTPLLAAGMHVPRIPVDLAQAHTYRFDAALGLLGMDGLEVAPIGRSTAVEMASSWPHPSFTGDFLPAQRVVGTAGFRAKWQTTHFATDSESRLREAERADRVERAPLIHNALGVAFVDPVDVYVQTERSVKYGLLFVGLTFLVFFLFEVLRKLAIHPIQYTLLGLALTLFYLLLLSLSEHLSFGASYLIAAGASTALLGFYVRHVLRSAKGAAGFVALLALLYGVLFVILRSEDYALLMGAVLLFVTLAVIMSLTRRLDWYQVGTQLRAGQGDKTGA